MRTKILDSLGMSASFKIGRRGDENPVEVSQLAAYQFCVRQRAHADRQVVAFPYDVDVSVRDIQFKFHAGMARQEFRSPRRNEHSPEFLRGGHTKQSFGFRGCLDHVFRILNGAKQWGNSLVIGLSLRGETERSRRPLDQPRAQSMLQSRDAFRDCGLAGADEPAGGAEGACIDSPDKRDQSRRLLEDGNHLGPCGITEATKLWILRNYGWIN